MKKRNIMKLADFIGEAKFPFDMCSYEVPSCGTAGCIAGHAAALWPGLDDDGFFDPVKVDNKLGLNDKQTEELFYPKSVFNGKSILSLITRGCAIECLRNFVITGKIRFLTSLMKGQDED